MLFSVRGRQRLPAASIGPVGVNHHRLQAGLSTMNGQCKGETVTGSPWSLSAPEKQAA